MFNVGDFVTYDAEGGSIGQIESISEHDDECYYHVRWSYGMDKFGKQVTAMSRYVHGNNLVSIKRDEWEARRKRKFNSSSEPPKLVPEDKLSTKYDTGYIHASPLFNAARYLMKKLILIDCGADEEITPTDLFFLQIMQHHHHENGGTHNRMPEDVEKFINRIQTVAEEKKKKS